MPRCSMNMLWNTQIVDTCIIFRSWHISSTATFLLSCAAIMSLAVFYEGLRAFQKRLDTRIALELANAAPTTGTIRLPDAEDADLLTERRIPDAGTPVPLFQRLLRATLYGISVFLSFFLMLVFMTYNAYLILATVLGAALGHFLFSGTIDVDVLLHEESKGIPCH
ncbi:Ctr copper transporter [Mycena maculata]|uniref:Copper transport protein n=1 Tax=Mycena maculata TaxID=230809 RepID=A0AAD7P202_9AGAR|nr:Ctr copper transporter [Mycena maculata]